MPLHTQAARQSADALHRILYSDGAAHGPGCHNSFVDVVMRGRSLQADRAVSFSGHPGIERRDNSPVNSPVFGAVHCAQASFAAAIAVVTSLRDRPAARGGRCPDAGWVDRRGDQLGPDQGKDQILRRAATGFHSGPRSAKPWSAPGDLGKCCQGLFSTGHVRCCGAAKRPVRPTSFGVRVPGDPPQELLRVGTALARSSTSRAANRRIGGAGASPAGRLSHKAAGTRNTHHRGNAPTLSSPFPWGCPLPLFPFLEMTR